MGLCIGKGSVRRRAENKGDALRVWPPRAATPAEMSPCRWERERPLSVPHAEIDHVATNALILTRLQRHCSVDSGQESWPADRGPLRARPAVMWALPRASWEERGKSGSHAVLHWEKPLISPPPEACGDPPPLPPKTGVRKSPQ